MLTFYDEKGNGYGAQVEFTTKNAVNGERSVSGTILSNDKVLSKIDRGWSFDWDGETYKVIYAKPKDEGRSLSVSFDAVHQFFYDFDHSNCYQVLNGSNRFEVYIEAIFRGSGYRYQIEAQANAIRKDNFGNTSRLKMFKDVIKAAGLEFSVTGKVVRIVKKVGTDLSTVVRKNFNMNELTLEKNIGGFITYKKGFGAWKDENNHNAGRYEAEYESPLARIYGRIEGEPISDERYKETGKLLERLKHDVDNSYSISVQLEMEDLTRAGYKYTQPRAGDYIMAINETIGFREKIRIVSYESSYDVTGRLLSHKVTCNDIGTVQKAISSEGSIMRSVGQSKEYAESALAIATRALVSADGKNTIYYGAEKPRDQPQGALHRGDLLYLTVGEETELYFWNGSEWELKHLKFDSSKLEKMFADSKATTDKAIVEANKRAEEALKKAGTLPDTTKLSDQIKQQILASQDLTQKITETLNQTDSGVVYNKVLQNIKNDFVEQKDINPVLAGLNQKIATQTIEFQKLTESNKLYERIIGKSEADAPDKLSRLVMSSEIFQTEVGKYSTQGGPNMLRNSRADDGLKYWTESNNRLGFTSHGFYFNGQKRMFELRPGAVVKSPRFIVKRNVDYILNILGFDNNSKYFKIYFCKRKKGSTADFEDKQLVFDGSPKWTNGPVFNNEKTVKKSFKFNIGEFDDGYLQFEYDRNNPNKWGGLFMTELDFYEGTNDRKWQPAPEDSAEPIEAVRTQMTLLSDSWSVRNLNSAGDVLGQLNLNPDGSIRINEGLLSVGEKTYIKDGVIKKSMIGKAQIGTAHIDEIDASKANLINVTSKNVATEGLTANIIKGGKLSSLNGVTEFDLQTGWIEANGQNIGIRNRFPGRPLQYLTFGKGRIGDVDGSYTALLSNRNGVQKMDSTSAGIQIWNGRSNGKIASAITFYGQSMDFLLSGQENLRGVSIDVGRREINGLLDIYIRDKSLVDLFNVIDKNFKGIEDHFKRHNLGAPGYYRTYM
ncbi:phage tail protein [Streptococcus sp. 400_SSPC]|uniref:phage tail protein n=1 Tax=Streptococcus sp. 400_SSPC TaxID=1579341 RepID=UPI00080B73B6|nr:phage tail protein [Streptococcus sp. 400_SSPC]